MTTLDSVEAELAAAHEAAELHREVVILLTGEISKLKRECDRALACEAAALGLLAALRARLAESEAEVSAARGLETIFQRKLAAAEARLSAATRVVEAAGALVAGDQPTLDEWLGFDGGPVAALRAALREWKEGSKP